MQAQAIVSELGDAFVSSAVAAAVIVWLWNRIGGVIALAFAVSFGGVFACAFALKLIARDLGRPLAEAGAFDFSRGAPSGHIALAATVFGCAAAVFLRLDRRPLGLAGAGLSLCALVAVAVTRVTLHVHTVADVAAGLILGAAGVALFARALKAQAPGQAVPADGLLFGMASIAVLALASGVRISSAVFL